MYFCTGIFRTRWIFGTILKIIIYLIKKKEKKDETSEHDYLKWFTAKSTMQYTNM